MLYIDVTLLFFNRVVLQVGTTNFTTLILQIDASPIIKEGVRVRVQVFKMEFHEKL